MASFTTQSAVEALASHGVHTGNTIPTVDQLTAQMDVDADAIRGALVLGGVTTDPTSGGLFGLCTLANALLSAAWLIGMHQNLKTTDMELQKVYLDRVYGKNGLFDKIVTVASSQSGLSAVSAAEFDISEVPHLQEMEN